MSEEVAIPAEDTKKPKTALLGKTRLIAATAALGGLIAGTFVELGLEKGVESTGLLGPSVESLLTEQESNFNEVNRRLDELRGVAADPELRASLADLGKLLERQDELTRHANAELRYLGEQVSTMRSQQLAETGLSGGADFWLKSGESVNVGSHSQVFGLIGARHYYADVNMNGTRKRVFVGDAIQFPGNEKSCTVFYKQALPRPDGRVGFDVNCS